MGAGPGVSIRMRINLCACGRGSIGRLYLECLQIRDGEFSCNIMKGEYECMCRRASLRVLKREGTRMRGRYHRLVLSHSLDL